MVLLEQNLPILEGLAMLVALTRTAINDGRPLPALAICIGSSIKRIPEHGNNVTVPYQRPVEVRQCPAIGRAWKVDLFGT
jgi:hypothetical protein